MIVNQQDCMRCPALVASRSRIVHGYGNIDSGIVFIGEAPGRHGADRSGLPFSGDKSGRVLRRMLRELGLLVDRQGVEYLGCFLTNVIRCCPPGNRTPLPREVARCADWLDLELVALNPRIVVPVGRIALREIGRRMLPGDPGSIRAAHACALQSTGRTIVPLVHPARISHAQIAAFLATMRVVLAAG
jgi:DNA polymerase